MMPIDPLVNMFHFMVTGEWMDPGSMTTPPEATEDFPIYDPSSDPHSFEPKTNDRGPQEDYSDE